MIEIHVYKELLTARGARPLEVDLQLEPGQLVTITGASGSGKTTLLRILAGLTAPDRGRIVFDGTTWLDTAAGANRPPQQRSVGLVFQDYALFPHLTVRENLAFALAPRQPAAIVEELLELMELTQLAARKPHTLSGGQQQRVALARALVRQPRLLLLDEPLSALDPAMRLKLQDHILRLHQKYGLTTVLVSHDVAEIFKLSDRVIVLEDGQIRQMGASHEVFAGQQVSGKFLFTGEVTAIEENEVVFIVSVLVGANIVKVIATAAERAQLQPGDKVMLVSKAFNPLILKVQ